MNKIKSYQCAVFCSVSCHVIELPIAPHFINRKMIIATFYLLLSALKVGFRWILGRFKVGYYRKRRSPLGRFFWISCELTPVCTLLVHSSELLYSIYMQFRTRESRCILLSSSLGWAWPFCQDQATRMVQTTDNIIIVLYLSLMEIMRQYQDFHVDILYVFEDYF